ncbi:MAG TPA: hypothetical protein VMT68_01505 [Caulobacteraceae bacterium]|nr:hypothetical protein [Caulobacteraceae bacterium]
MAKAYLRVYETQDTNPETNSAIGEPNLTPDGLGAFLRGKTTLRFATRERYGAIVELIFYLSDGSTMIISNGGIGSTDLMVDILKKK